MLSELAEINSNSQSYEVRRLIKDEYNRTKGITSNNGWQNIGMCVKYARSKNIPDKVILIIYYDGRRIIWILQTYN